MGWTRHLAETVAAVVAVMAVTWSLGGCGTDEISGDTAAPTSNPSAAPTSAPTSNPSAAPTSAPTSAPTVERITGCHRFVVLDDPRWERGEAIDLPEGPGPLFDEPGLDWYSEQDRYTARGGGVIHGAHLRLSGHEVDIDELRGEILGFAWSPAPGGPPGVLVGSGPPRTGPNIVLVPTEDRYTLMALSSDLEVSDLLAIASNARPVCEQEWVDEGGIILDCVPTEPACVAGR